MGIFSGLFSRKEKLLDPAELAVLKTDVHSHFIPGIDDGAPDMDSSLELLKSMQDFGYQKVVTTPHIMSDYYKNTPDIILSGLDALREAALKNGITLQIEAAAEYYLDFELEGKAKRKELLTFGNNYVLFEMPFITEPPMLKRTIFEMQMAGYRPVLAHVERYTFWHKDWSRFEDMLDKGVILQLNMNSLSGHYSIPTKKTAEKLIDAGMVKLLGSDCHNMNHIDLLKDTQRLPYLHKALQIPGLLNPNI